MRHQSAYVGKKLHIDERKIAPRRISFTPLEQWAYTGRCQRQQSGQIGVGSSAHTAPIREIALWAVRYVAPSDATVRRAFPKPPAPVPPDVFPFSPDVPSSPAWVDKTVSSIFVCTIDAANQSRYLGSYEF